MSKMEVQSNNEKQQTVNTPKLVNVKVTVDKPNQLVDTDSWNVEYTSTTRTQQFTDKCQIEVKVADSSESSDNPAGSEHNLTLTVESTDNKVFWTLRSSSVCNVKETVAEETNFENKRIKGHSSDGESSSCQAEKELKQNSSLDDELDSKNNWKLNKNSEQDFDTFEEYWKKFTCFQVVREQESNLFGMPNEYSLVHFVPEDFDWRHGIVGSFISQFKNLGYLYSQKQKQGGVAYLKNQERYVYYLVTKRIYSDKQTYRIMWNSLCRLRLRMEEHGVKRLAVPKLVCSWDRLEWVKVKAMIEKVFEGMEDVEIVVCNFQQEKQINLKCGITYLNGKLLHEMTKDTIWIYLGCEDDTETDIMKSIDRQHPFLDSSYKTTERKIGKVVVTKLKECTLTGFIVRKCKSEPVDFVAFETCAQQLNREIKKWKTPYHYAAMEDFKDPQDELMINKFINILRFVLGDVYVYVYKI